MSPAGELIIGLCMATGLLGTIIPILPGIILMWATGLTWTIMDGGGWMRWLLFTFMTILTIIATLASVKIPAKKISQLETPRGTLIVASLFGMAGFFVIPVLGLPIGFILGIFLWNLIHSREFHRALQTTWQSAKSFGQVALIQLLCGLGIVGMWLIGLLI